MKNIQYQPDIFGMRERIICDDVPRNWYGISKKNVDYYREVAPCLIKERNEIAHKSKEYRFKND